MKYNERVLNRIETELAKVLKSQIRSQGPLTFRDFMTVALYDKAYGFYARGPNIGSPEGPFDTNAKFPAFGFAIAQAIEQAEKNLGYPLRILELGGGTGQLGKNVISFLQRPHEYIVLEISQGLRANQEQAGLQTIQNLNDLLPGPTFIFGNEVLDALPVHRVMGTENREVILELYVDLDEDGEFFERPRFLSTSELAKRFGCEGIQLGRGQVAEICLELKPLFRDLRQVLERGYVIFIDYGDMASNLYSYQHRNGTLRSYYNQEQTHDPFFAVGLQDLTADVDYTAILSAAEEAGFECGCPIQQGTWLQNVGIQAYLESAGNRHSAEKELDQLIRPSGLGSAFDVLIFKTPDLPDGPGLQQCLQ
jgi:SAM-dependent MidA family methyltransferase